MRDCPPKPRGPADAFASYDVLSFWFAQPATDEATLRGKFTRWYEGGEGLVHTIRARFGGLVERALGNELPGFRENARGRLALILLLDQFTRRLHAGEARAYAGDPLALELSLAELATGSYRRYGLEERLFVLMPLAHAEDLTLQTRALVLARALVAEAPEPLRTSFGRGVSLFEQRRTVIARFGRFPHRNRILGRASSAEERAYMAHDARVERRETGS